MYEWDLVLVLPVVNYNNPDLYSSRRWIKRKLNTINYHIKINTIQISTNIYE